MRRSLFPSLLLLLASQGWMTGVHAQGWPSQYEGVMLQGFYWDSYTDSQWEYLERQADELSQSFSLVWGPKRSVNCRRPTLR